MNVRAIALAVLILNLAGSRAAAGLIINGSFEAVPSGATGQGLLPSNWLNATAIVPGADTYSNNGSYGLSPGSFGNFPGVTAFDGIRWVAGSSFGRRAGSATVGGEAFGTTLTTALTPGVTYLLDAYLHQALRSDLNNSGGYDLFLAADNSSASLSAAVLLGALAPTTGTSDWQARSLSFVAPAGAASRPFLVFAPYQSTAGNSYTGIDAVSLAEASAVPEPTSAALLALGGIVLAAARCRRTPSGFDS